VTELMYQLDSYLRAFEATVVDTNADQGAIVLDRTAFYPGGGGQPNDVGSVHVGDRQLQVTRVKRQGGSILHWIDGELPKVGEKIVATLDWGRRLDLMRTHTAFHVLCGVVWRDYGAQVTGGNMRRLSGRMDFEFERMGADLVHEIEDSVNAEISKAHPITVRILPREEAFKTPDLIRTKINLLPEGIREVRIVEIEGLDLQADGGTHVANTNEVGAVRVVGYKSKGRINKRINMEITS